MTVAVHADPSKSQQVTKQANLLLALGSEHRDSAGSIEIETAGVVAAWRDPAGAVNARAAEQLVSAIRMSSNDEDALAGGCATWPTCIRLSTSKPVALRMDDGLRVYQRGGYRGTSRRALHSFNR